MWRCPTSLVIEDRGFFVTTCTVALMNGRTVTFKVQNEPGKGTFFIFGVRKSGSSILNSICTALSKANGINSVDVGGKFFSENVEVSSWITDRGIHALVAEGNVFGGFREMPVAFQSNPQFSTALKVLMVRDPRDALVSEYFSNAFSHAIPTDVGSGNDVTRQMTSLRSQALQSDLDAFVVQRASSMNQVMCEYSVILGDAKTLVLKYEDVILQKSMLIDRICSHFGWSCTESLLKDILSWADVVPEKEDPRAFVRRVIPGDHATKLGSATVSRLNVILKPSMDLYGYS